MHVCQYVYMCMYAKNQFLCVVVLRPAYSSGQKKGLVPYSLNDRTDAALRFKK